MGLSLSMVLLRDNTLRNLNVARALTGRRLQMRRQCTKGRHVSICGLSSPKKWKGDARGVGERKGVIYRRQGQS
jgi:hypothetical protein